MKWARILIIGVVVGFFPAILVVAFLAGMLSTSDCAPEWKCNGPTQTRSQQCCP